MTPAPWVWVIHDRHDPRRVHAHGEQHTRPYAPAAAIAAERIAGYAWQVMAGSGDLDALAGAVCRVRRHGARVWEAAARGEVWARRIEQARR